MTLGFSQEINGKPNYFIEKIHASLPKSNVIDDLGCPLFYEYYEYFEYRYNHRFNHTEWDKCPKHREALRDGFDIYKYTPKLHTIRLDPKNRWKAGNKIHPVINNQTTNRFQFAPVLECKSVQKIDIIQRNDLPMTSDHQRYGYRQMVTVRGMDFYSFYQVKVDGNLLEKSVIEELAISDGFDDADAFFDYFATGINNGKLIHWTDLKY